MGNKLVRDLQALFILLLLPSNIGGDTFMCIGCVFMIKGNLINRVNSLIRNHIVRL